MLNLPSNVSESGEVIRDQANFSIETVYDKYDDGDVELKKLLDGIFMNMAGFVLMKESCAGSLSTLNSIAARMIK